ncbi:MAG: DNA repair protein RecO [Clostridia bacterium]|jgi:DNA repair protein RecO (recombination protein O)|nr:DNA repair protein RecO [Clostridia bacterium]
MSIEKFDGIVLKETELGETGKRLTVFAKDIGKITVSAKGAKSAKSRFSAPSQLFCYSSFSAYKNKNFYNAVTAEVIESFYEIRTDIKKLAYACFITELTDKNLMEGQSADELLRLLLTALAVISKTDYDERLAALVFETKFLNLSGYFAQADKCAECGIEITDEGIFNASKGGVLCHDCGTLCGGEKLLAGTLSAFEYILLSKGKKMFSFRVSKEVLVQMEKCLGEMIKEYMVMPENSAEFLKSVE